MRNGPAGRQAHLVVAALAIAIMLPAASTRSQEQLVLQEGLVLVGFGLLAGLAAALVFARLLSGFLYDVPTLDPITFLLVPILLSGAAFAACLIPSYRASAIDPMNALRHE